MNATLNPPRTLRHVRAAVHGEPWAITQQGQELICGIIEAHCEGFETKEKQWLFGRPDFLKAGKLRDFSVAEQAVIRAQNGDTTAADEYEAYSVVDGVALLPLQGPLFPKANMITEFSGATSYQEFQQWGRDALSRDDVNAICIVSDSPGGYCSGMFECADEVFAWREAKPTVGLATPGNGACSAAYAILSQCETVYLTRSALMGSIGIICDMVSWDRATENEGGKITRIASDELKGYGAPETMAQYTDLQGRVKVNLNGFRETILRARPKVNLETIGSRVFTGPQAVAVGLADGIKSLDQIIAEFRS